jgi:hypothetical protein
MVALHVLVGELSFPSSGDRDMADASGSASVNLQKGKKCHIVLTDPDGRFQSTTDVQNPVQDTQNNGVSFTAEVRWKHGGTKNRLPIRLTSEFTGIRGRDGTGPTDGQLSVTLTNTTVTPNPVPVDVQYVNDNELQP